MKTPFSLLPTLFCLLVFFVVSCKKEDPVVTPGTTTPPGSTTGTTTTKSTAKAISAFAFNSLSPAIAATIDATAKTITATLPAGTDVTKLVPTLTISDKATTSPTSGVAQDFSKAVTYTVTAEDGSTQAYVVGVVVPTISNTFSDAVQQVVPLEIIESAKSIGIVLYGGNTPPNVEGTYRMADCVVVESEDKDLVGRVIQPITFNFSNYNTSLQSIVQRQKQSNGNNGLTATTYYVSGTGNFFTLVSTFTNSAGRKYFIAISGELTATGIREFRQTTFYYENKKAIIDLIIRDKDGVSEKQTTF